jgi:hypothetical protein
MPNPMLHTHNIMLLPLQLLLLLHILLLLHRLQFLRHTAPLRSTMVQAVELKAQQLPKPTGKQLIQPQPLHRTHKHHLQVLSTRNTRKLHNHLRRQRR